MAAIAYLDNGDISGPSVLEGVITEVGEFVLEIPQSLGQTTKDP